MDLDTTTRGRARRRALPGFAPLGFALLVAMALACGSGEPAAEAGGATDAAASGGAAETTASGLEITHLREGSGPNPSAGDVVEVHYHGTFEDGRVFDSSVQRGQPAVFPLTRVIPCWTEGVQKIKVGGKARLVCPPGIAYGARGAPPTIPPNATLTFEVELISIK